MHIDAHVHFWKYNKKRDAWITSKMKILQEDYLPPALALTLKRNGMDGCIAVQADQSEVETRFLVELAKSYPIIKGVVGWIDFKAADIEQKLAEFLPYSQIKGYRYILEGHDVMSDAEFIKGVRALTQYDYTYDILVNHQQLPGVLKLIDQCPDQRMILDHCGKPPIASKQLDEWAKQIQLIAQNPNVFCKLSGLFTEAKWKEWSASDFYPYLDVIFKTFGTDRLVFASDWPVMLLSGMYVQWKSMINKYMENMPDEKEKVFGDNAINFYRL